MTQNKKTIVIVIFLLMTAVFTYYQFQNIATLKSRYPAVSIRINGDGVTEQAIKRALKEEGSRGGEGIPAVTAWTRDSETDIINPVLGNKVRITPVIVSGDMKLACPILVIDGNLVYRDDGYGCVIDSKTAYQLYGTKNAAGNTINYKGKSYYVRGVVRSQYPLLMLQGDDNKIAYHNLELSYHNKERGEEFANQFMYQNSLGYDFMVIDGYVYARMLGTILWIPIWLLYMAAIVLIIRIYTRSNRSYQMPERLVFGGICLLVILVAGGLLVNLTGSPFYLPEKLIPTKWSDFDYWSRQYNTIMTQIKQMKLLTPNPKDILLKEEFITLPYRLLTSMLLYTGCFLIMYRPVTELISMLGRSIKIADITGKLKTIKPKSRR